jgi:hypothetical protein
MADEGGSFDLDFKYQEPVVENHPESLNEDSITDADVIAYDSALTPIQRTFIREYLVNLSLTKTARMLNIPTARVQEWVKLKHFQVSLYSVVVRRHQQTEELTEFTIDNLKGLISSDICDYVTWDAQGNLSVVPLEELRRKGISTKTIKFIRQTRYGLEISLHDKVGAVQLMMQGLGLMKKPTRDRDPELDEETEQGLLEALQEAQLRRQKDAEKFYLEAGKIKVDYQVVNVQAK